MKNLIVWLHFILLLFSGELLAADSNIRPINVAVVVNTANANSLEIGQYYLKLRGIPKVNLIKVSIPGNPRKLNIEQFDQLRQQIADKLNPDIQVLCRGV